MISRIQYCDSILFIQEKESLPIIVVKSNIFFHRPTPIDLSLSTASAHLENLRFRRYKYKPLILPSHFEPRNISTSTWTQLGMWRFLRVDVQNDRGVVRNVREVRMPPVNSPDNCVAARVLLGSWRKDNSWKEVLFEHAVICIMCVCVYPTWDYESTGEISILLLCTIVVPSRGHWRPAWVTLKDVNLTGSNSGDLYPCVCDGYVYRTVDALHKLYRFYLPI